MGIGIKMKKIIFMLILLCSSLFTFSACDDFIEYISGDSTNLEQPNVETEDEEQGNNESETPNENDGSGDGEEIKGKPVKPIQNGGIINFN